MQEEGGEEDTQYVNRDGDGKDVIIEIRLILNSKESPDQPAHIKNCADRHVDPSEPPTKPYSVVSSTDNTTTTTTTNGQSGESEVSDSGEDNEGGLSVEDLQRGFREEVQGGEEREEEWQNDQQTDGEGDIYITLKTLIYNIYTN